MTIWPFSVWAERRLYLTNWGRYERRSQLLFAELCETRKELTAARAALSRGELPRTNQILGKCLDRVNRRIEDRTPVR